MDYLKRQMHEDDFLGGYPVVTKNDRDCEVPNLISYIKDRAPVKSLLDVGCAHSHLSYAKAVKGLVELYHGIDVVDSPETKEILDYCYKSNVIDCNFDFFEYDLVTCVSVIEHAGLSTYKANFRRERYRLFERLLDLSKKDVWLSFHVGLEYIACNNEGNPDFCAVTRQDLEYFELLATFKGWKLKERFFYTQGAQAGYPWREHEDRDLALKVPYMDFIGNQSICIMELSKREEGK